MKDKIHIMIHWGFEIQSFDTIKSRSFQTETFAIEKIFFDRNNGIIVPFGVQIEFINDTF